MPGYNHLFIPGPTSIPDRTRQAINRPMEDMRSPSDPELTLPPFAGVRRVFKNQNGPVFIYPPSGTGDWEAPVTNVLSPCIDRRGHSIERLCLASLPSGAVNRHLIDARRLRLMKSDAFLANTARGDVIDNAVLLDALKARMIAGAGLDVYEDEPAISEGLTKREHVVLLPHLGSATEETRTLPWE